MASIRDASQEYAFRPQNNTNQRAKQNFTASPEAPMPANPRLDNQVGPPRGFNPLSAPPDKIATDANGQPLKYTPPAPQYPDSVPKFVRQLDSFVDAKDNRSTTEKLGASLLPFNWVPDYVADVHRYASKGQSPTIPGTNAKFPMDTFGGRADHFYTSVGLGLAQDLGVAKAAGLTGITPVINGAKTAAKQKLRDLWDMVP